ncbi:hypothetical protein [Methylocapsa palsarum]|uniref:hypothetical protein n=1 Tax=Methylocapsa palsarum TaxID=1612308 RepID=UPI0011146478|nr:hypothetical protein [Methylocapsa palsarum]
MHEAFVAIDKPPAGEPVGGARMKKNISATRLGAPPRVPFGRGRFSQFTGAGLGFRWSLETAVSIGNLHDERSLEASRKMTGSGRFRKGSFSTKSKKTDGGVAKQSIPLLAVWCDASAVLMAENVVIV